MLVTRFHWVFSIFIANTNLKTFKLVLTFTKYVREPWLNNANFKKSIIRSAARLINMSWLHYIKTRHEQQKEPNYLKNKPYSESSNYFWNAWKELSKKCEKSNFQSSLLEVLLKNTVLEFLFNRPATYKFV